MASRPHVFIARRLPVIVESLLGDTCDLEVWPEDLPPSADILRAKIADCDGLVSLLTDRIDEPLLASAPKLKVVSNFAVGYNNIDIAAATRRGVLVGNTPNALDEATADTAVMLLLAASRRLLESATAAKGGRWKTWEPMGWIGQDLRGKTLGIVGMGRIGFATAHRLHRAWGMRVIYTKRTPSQEAEQLSGAKRVEMDELLRTSDFVSVHCSLNDETKGLFGSAAFGKMKPTAVFVNTSRGPVVDQVALAEALRSGKIFAAGLDVTDPEPLPPTHELFALPNCTIVPHIASATTWTRNEMGRICAENLLAGLRGDPMISCVNPEAKESR